MSLPKIPCDDCPYETATQLERFKKGGGEMFTSVGDARKSTAPSEPAREPSVVWAMLMNVLDQDNGYRHDWTSEQMYRARKPIRALQEAGYFADDPDNLDHSFWNMAAGEESEREEFFAKAPEAFKELDALLNEVFDPEPARADEGLREAFVAYCKREYFRGWTEEYVAATMQWNGKKFANDFYQQRWQVWQAALSTAKEPVAQTREAVEWKLTELPPSALDQLSNAGNRKSHEARCVAECRQYGMPSILAEEWDKESAEAITRIEALQSILSKARD